MAFRIEGDEQGFGGGVGLSGCGNGMAVWSSQGVAEKVVKHEPG